MGSVLGWLAFGVLAGTFGFWFHRMRQVRTADVRARVIGLMAVSLVLAVGAFASGTGLGSGIAAGFALVASGLFLALQLQAGQAANTPAVAVGGPILDFTAPDDSGETFDLATLRGRPFLLKFFRGHW